MIKNHNNDEALCDGRPLPAGRFLFKPKHPFIKKGQNVFKFGFGQSPFQVPKDVISELQNNAHRNKYLPMQGLKELREAVAKYTTNKKSK